MKTSQIWGSWTLKIVSIVLMPTCLHALIDAHCVTRATCFLGTKIIEVAEDGFLTLPDGEHVRDRSGALLILPPGQCTLVGPDGKPVLDTNGQVTKTFYI